MSGATSRAVRPPEEPGQGVARPAEFRHGPTQATCDAELRGLVPGRDSASHRSRHLVRLAELCTEAAEILGSLADIQLDESRHPRLMDGVGSSSGSVAATSAPRRLLTARDVAALLQVDAKTVRRWREEGKLPPAVELGGVVRWLAEDLAVWLKEQLR